MHSPHAAFIFRELHRQDLRSFAEQQRLVKLACAGKPCANANAATPHAVLAFVHRLTAFMPFSTSERQPAPSPATAADAPASVIAP
jgi:hypothetical protein